MRINTVFCLKWVRRIDPLGRTYCVGHNISGPLALTVRVWSKYNSFRRGAERLGAVIPREMGSLDQDLRGV